MHLISALGVALCTSGCFTAGYLVQAAGGQYEILHLARPISKVVEDPVTPPRIRQLLSAVPDVKQFALREGLKPTRNYTRYTDLHRPAVVWVVRGCAPLSFESKHWSFPLVGTVPYLGFFDAERARAYAAQLEAEEHLDVSVRGTSAYSTLGWFRDPVLSTMIPEAPEALAELANVLIHESVHATLYLPGQSSFDESLASFVADRLTHRWLVQRFGAFSDASVSWVEGQRRGEARVERLHQAYVELDALYRSTRSDAEKLAEKTRVLEALKKELGLLKLPNNATLAGYKTYSTGEVELERLLKACDGDFRRFFEALRGLKASDFGQAQLEDFGPVVDRLALRGCASSKQ